MSFKNSLFFSQCRKYGIPLWQCPDFLFLIFGLIIISLIFLSFAILSQYIKEPRLVALIILILAQILLLFSFIVTKSFEKLAEANRMKSEFINIVSHQLGSPITNLKFAIETLMSGKLGKIEPEQLDYFKILKENAYRMLELLKDLLLVSKIETAKLLPKREEFFLQELTQEVIKEYEPFAKASNVEIKFFFKEDLPKIIGDRFQIRHVIENLLDNAIRYTRGKGLVQIRIERKKDKIHFEIEDNGVGIPKEDQKFIFQKFFRSSNVLKHHTRGAGLGLYISKAIVEKAGGKIGFSSQEGKGSKFWFYLPLR